MKIFAMTDMEGVCGIINFEDWCKPGGRYYEDGKMLLTQEVNASVEGFFNAGADEIVIVDGHGHGAINQLFLDNRTIYSRGWNGPYPFGLFSSFDAIAYIGQHAKAGTTYGHLCHTGSFCVENYCINGISVGEFGQIAMIGSTLGIPVIFGSGDKAFTLEAEALVKGIVTVAVKQGINPNPGDECKTAEYAKWNLGCLHMHPEKARKLIREGSERALRKFSEDKESFKLVDIKPPFKRVVKYRANEAEPGYSVFSEHPSDIVAMINAREMRVDK